MSESTSTEDATGATYAGVPRAAIFVSLYHLALLVGSIWFAMSLFDAPLICCSSEDRTDCSVQPANVIQFAAALGVLGGTILASRVVVWTVRHKKYDSNRVLWQLLAPIHGGALAVAGIFIIMGGFLAVEASPKSSDKFAWFVGALAFLIGFSAESFVKALRRAADALFDPQQDSSTGSRRDG